MCANDPDAEICSVAAYNLYVFMKKHQLHKKFPLLVKLSVAGDEASGMFFFITQFIGHGKSALLFAGRVVGQPLAGDIGEHASVLVALAVADGVIKGSTFQISFRALLASAGAKLQVAPESIATMNVSHFPFRRHPASAAFTVATTGRVDGVVSLLERTQARRQQATVGKPQVVKLPFGLTFDPDKLASNDVREGAGPEFDIGLDNIDSDDSSNSSDEDGIVNARQEEEGSESGESQEFVQEEVDLVQEEPSSKDLLIVALGNIIWILVSQNKLVRVNSHHIINKWLLNLIG